MLASSSFLSLSPAFDEHSVQKIFNIEITPLLLITNCFLADFSTGAKIMFHEDEILGYSMKWVSAGYT